MPLHAAQPLAPRRGGAVAPSARRTLARTVCQAAPAPARGPAPQPARGPAPVRAVVAPEETLPPGVAMSGIELASGSKRLQVQWVPDIAPGTHAIRCLDWDRDRFDIEFGLVAGTTYNSFLIFGADKTALVDASHEKFRGLYLAELNARLAAAGRTLDYIIVSHTEPDHSGTVPDVLAAHPGATVLASRVALSYLANLTHAPFPQAAVKAGETVDLGGGHLLEFVPAPNLHWPDTMFTHDPASATLFTCDAFGAHYCVEAPYDADLVALSPHFRFYFECLMLPNARSVSTALRKISGLKYATIGTGHGPILRHNVKDLVGKYGAWAAAAGKNAAAVAVLYCSGYGSERLSQSLARGITKAGGVGVEMVDLLSAEPQEVAEAAGRSSGLVIMAPPDDSPGARANLATLLSKVRPSQRVLVAESYGGRDEPVDTLLSSLVDVGVTPFGVGALRVRDTPSEATFQAFEEAGTDLAQALTQKADVAALKAAMPPDLSKALARLSGGLYVVTAAHGASGARSAMIASWVAQASFEPPGLTVAVAKDRAVESLMQVGDTFVLNCLGEARFGPAMKHFLQRFPPGADRFEGIAWRPDPSCGVPVLEDAIAHLACRVVSRLETPDHFVTYAAVEGGGVADADARTAVHRRKVANYY